MPGLLPPATSKGPEGPYTESVRNQKRHKPASRDAIDFARPSLTLLRTPPEITQGYLLNPQVIAGHEVAASLPCRARNERFLGRQFLPLLLGSFLLRGNAGSPCREVTSGNRGRPGRGAAEKNSPPGLDTNPYVWIITVIYSIPSSERKCPMCSDGKKPTNDEKRTSDDKPATGAEATTSQRRPARGRAVRICAGTCCRGGSGRKLCCHRSRSLPWRAIPARRSQGNWACPAGRSGTGCKRCGRSGSPRRRGRPRRSSPSRRRLNGIYREAMQAWRDSLWEREMRLVEDTQAASDNGRATKQKTLVRTHPPRRNAALLARATAAAKALGDLNRPVKAPPSPRRRCGRPGRFRWRPWRSRP